MKIGIFTIIGRGPGARLQNYALQEFLKKFFNVDVETIKRIDYFYEEKKKKNIIKNSSYKRILKGIINYRTYKNWLKKEKEVQPSWLEFDKNVKFTKTMVKKVCGPINKSFNDEFDYIIVGSDQVWNPYWYPNIDFLKYIDKKKRISYAASFGVDKIPFKLQQHFKDVLNNMEYITVREEAGAKIVKDLTGRDVNIVVDPTLLLTKEDWLKIAKCPKWCKNNNYIIAYFIGSISNNRQKQIDNIAKNLNTKVVYLFSDTNLDWAKIGPNEFIYLIANSKAVLTDSFHGTVFSIIMNTPFFVFDRKQSGVKNMNSRIDTLLNLFDMKERYINHDKLIKDDINKIDFSSVEKIQIRERLYSKNYLKEIIE